MSYPWTDECLAMAGKLQAMQPVRGHEWTCYVDITPGAPRIWQVEAMMKALAYLGDEHLIYGSDCSDPDNGGGVPADLERRTQHPAGWGASSEAVDRVVNANALK